MINTPEYFINGQHRITINVVGAGGTGSLVVTKLARLNQALNMLEHPGLYVTCIDYDEVEEHNVGRQMFSQNDIGEYKCDTLISKINLAFGLDWDCKVRAFDSKEDSKCNIMIVAVDNISARDEIYSSFFEKQNSYHTNEKFFLIDCGNARDYGQVILTDFENSLKSINDIIPNWREQDTEEIQGASCSYAESLLEQDLFINDWVSLYAVTIIKDLMFKKQIDYQGFFFNTEEFLTQKIKL